MNEKDAKEYLRSGGMLCSVTGRPCKCESGSGCTRSEKGYRTSVDNLPNELVRRLKTLALHLDIAKQDTLYCQEYDELTRIWPQPELRDIDRKLAAIQSTIEEILS